jgi:hypothetical protein
MFADLDTILGLGFVVLPLCENGEMNLYTSWVRCLGCKSPKYFVGIRV